jgi:8-oxo-dGTP pyrophosphatase MutT (NUDIX family)
MEVDKDVDDLQLMGRMLKVMPNCPEYARTAKEVAGYLRHEFEMRQDLPKKRINTLLYHLQTNKEVKSILLDGKVHWYRIPEKGEPKGKGLVERRKPVAERKLSKALKEEEVISARWKAPPPIMQAQVVNEFPSRKDDLGLTDDELLALATAMSLDDLAKDQIIKVKDDRFEEPGFARMQNIGENNNFSEGWSRPIINIIDLDPERRDYDKLDVGLNFPFIKNHGVEPGSHYGKEPFYYEEVLHWYNKFNTFNYASMSSITGASVAILRKDRFVYLFKERPDKLFNLPGGKREIDETPFQTLVRELKEEGVLLKGNLMNQFRFPDLISLGTNVKTGTYGYNWTWVIPEDSVELPDKECKWIDVLDYKANLADAPYVARIVLGLNRRGFDVYFGRAYTTWLFSCSFKEENVYEGVIVMKIPWNNMS